MDEEQCREAVLSEEYRDFMFTDRFLSLLLREGTLSDTACGGTLYQNVYLPRTEEAERLPENEIPYYSIPKCYHAARYGGLKCGRALRRYRIIRDWS